MRESSIFTDAFINHEVRHRTLIHKRRSQDEHRLDRQEKFNVSALR